MDSTHNIPNYFLRVGESNIIFNNAAYGYSANRTYLVRAAKKMAVELMKMDRTYTEKREQTAFDNLDNGHSALVGDLYISVTDM